MCIKNTQKINTCDLEKVRSQTEILHINSSENVHVIEMSLNEINTKKLNGNVT